jgi:hypothetical protein
MKQIILLLLFLLVLSCDKKPSYEQGQEQLLKKIETELTSQKTNDTILLGATLTMSKDAFLLKIFEAMGNEIVTRDEKGFFKMQIANQPFIILSGYYKDELSNVDLVFDYDNYNSRYYYNNISLKNDLKNSLSQKYGEPLVVDLNSNKEYDRNYYWVSGNRIISISDDFPEYDDRVVVRYYDITMDELRKQAIIKDEKLEEHNNLLKQQKENQKQQSAL